MTIEYESSFTVFPQDCNYNSPPCIFGGKMLAEIDNCAATNHRRALYGTGCTDAVTVKVDVEFLRPAYIGDIVIVKGQLVEVGHKSLTILISCTREAKDTGMREQMSKGKLKFVARKDGVPAAHNIIDWVTGT